MKAARRPGNEYFHGDRSDLLAWLGGRYRNVLEIGCGAGGNARWLREHGAERIVGIEIDPISVTQANTVFDLVIDHPVDIALTRVEERFDLIICADVLEHLIEPWSVVTALATKAEPGATFVASIPNVRFIRALWQIAFGAGFRYEDQGIFDRTHLRFFTRSGIEKMLVDGGWQPLRWGYSTSPWAHRLGVRLWQLTGARSGEWFTYQWFVAATLAPKPGTAAGEEAGR